MALSSLHPDSESANATQSTAFSPEMLDALRRAVIQSQAARQRADKAAVGTESANSTETNLYGFTPAMVEALQQQQIGRYRPFANVGDEFPPQFEEAAALLTVIARGFDLRDEVGHVQGFMNVGASEFDLLSPGIFATALLGIANHIHTGVLMHRVSES